MEKQTYLNDKSTSWIESLAMDELNMDESGIVTINSHLDPAFYLEEASVELMNKLRDLFELYVSKFNEYRGQNYSSSQIKIFKISNTVNDFMLFRNSLRLILSRKSHDLISVGFLTTSNEIYSPRLSTRDTFSEGRKNSEHLIRAHLGPFNKISWQFDGENVDLDALVKFYMSEFIVNSAR